MNIRKSQEYYRLCMVYMIGFLTFLVSYYTLSYLELVWGIRLVLESEAISMFILVLSGIASEIAGTYSVNHYEQEFNPKRMLFLIFGGITSLFFIKILEKYII